jgi:hypothetical protein
MRVFLSEWINPSSLILSIRSWISKAFAFSSLDLSLLAVTPLFTPWEQASHYLGTTGLHLYCLARLGYSGSAQHIFMVDYFVNPMLTARQSITYF